MESIKESGKIQEKLGQNEIYDLLTNNELGWQAIIYDLINTEQLNPWDIDLAFLANKYLEKIKQLEEANFFISSKVLLAASIMLRLKSEILLYDYVKSIDDILFGKKEVESKQLERIEIDENDLPLLYPKTPLPRYRKVSLQELMTALDKAINTETRRIKKEVVKVQQEKSADIVLPKAGLKIGERIRNIYAKILTAFKRKQARISYSELTGNTKEEKISCFLPCLHLDNQHKVFLQQESHFQEIWVWLYQHYKSQGLKQELKQEIAEEKASEEISKETGFDNPLASFFNLS